MSETDIQECVDWLMETRDNHNISTVKIEKLAELQSELDEANLKIAQQYNRIIALEAENAELRKTLSLFGEEG